jgi:hypothetical protein
MNSSGEQPPHGFAGRLAALCIDSRITPLLVLASLLLGAFAVIMLPREEEPQIKVPMVDVIVAMPGATAREVENRVTRPMEKLLWEIPGVEYLYATSSPGRSLVIVRFQVGSDLEQSRAGPPQPETAGQLRPHPAGRQPPLVKPRTIDDVPVARPDPPQPHPRPPDAPPPRRPGRRRRQGAAGCRRDHAHRRRPPPAPRASRSSPPRLARAHARRPRRRPASRQRPQSGWRHRHRQPRPADRDRHLSPRRRRCRQPRARRPGSRARSTSAMSPPSPTAPPSPRTTCCSGRPAAPARRPPSRSAWPSARAPTPSTVVQSLLATVDACAACSCPPMSRSPSPATTAPPPREEQRAPAPHGHRRLRRRPAHPVFPRLARVAGRAARHPGDARPHAAGFLPLRLHAEPHHALRADLLDRHPGGRRDRRGGEHRPPPAPAGQPQPFAARRSPSRPSARSATRRCSPPGPSSPPCSPWRLSAA